MLAFVTGATGFLGSHVAKVLADQGAELRLLVRSSSNLKNLHGLKAETVVGDLRDAASLEKAIAGCDTVFHVAADYRLWVRDPDEMYRSNVEGTRALLEAAGSHEGLWHPGNPLIAAHQSAATAIYGPDPSAAQAAIVANHVRYVYVGPQEAQTYAHGTITAPNLTKFAQFMRIVYRANGVTIYRA